MLLKNDNNRLEVCLDLQNYYINYLGIRCSLTEYWYDIKKKLLDLDTSAFNTYWGCFFYNKIIMKIMKLMNLL